MATEYFPCLFRLGGADHYVIWYSDDRDGLLQEPERRRLDDLMRVYRRGLVRKAQALRTAVARGLRPRLG